MPLWENCVENPIEYRRYSGHKSLLGRATAASADISPKIAASPRLRSITTDLRPLGGSLLSDDLQNHRHLVVAAQKFSATAISKIEITECNRLWPRLALSECLLSTKILLGWRAGSSFPHHQAPKIQQSRLFSHRADYGSRSPSSVLSSPS